MAGIPANNYTQLTTSYQTGLQISTGQTILERITINLTTATTLGIIDGTSGVTINGPRFAANAVVGTYHYGIVLAKGLRVTAPAHLGDITIVWRQ